MLLAQTRRARGHRVPAIAAVSAALLVLTAGCGGGSDSDKSDDKPTVSDTPSEADLATAAAAFSAAHTTFQADFEAGTALSAGDAATLEDRTAAVRAVRTAYYDFDAAIREIAMPADLTADVNALLTAIGTAIAKFDILGAVTTDEAFTEANVPATDAYVAADAALQTVLVDLGLAEETPTPTPTPTAPESPTSTQTPVDAPYIDGTSVTDAAAWRDDLLSIGAANVDPDVFASSGSYGIVESWVAAFPDLLPVNGIEGDQIEAPASGVSGFTIYTVDDKDLPSATNPLYLAFAVKDASGACAGGILIGYPSPSTGRPVDVPAGEDCTSATVAAVGDLSP
ncbi:hypothetical protein F0U44_01615 [Nocardioides humilatus]|uniref:Uncharacterized protein n=1 Tax=Nocardioides humilatus TaxID=2607660 RepID=A0A5B1LK12_9ACTN|nr:hypothetical protein [Nocardioides humilatus]KAA1421051.1 hypothetical protein F0U44_01615 [Nocardioides humilatus]